MNSQRKMHAKGSTETTNRIRQRNQSFRGPGASIAIANVQAKLDVSIRQTSVPIKIKFKYKIF